MGPEVGGDDAVAEFPRQPHRVPSAFSARRTARGGEAEWKWNSRVRGRMSRCEFRNLWWKTAGFESVKDTESNLLWTKVGKDRVEVMGSWLENQSDEPGLVGVKVSSKPGRKRRGWMSGHSAGRVKSRVHEKADSGESAFVCSILVMCQDHLISWRLNVAQVSMDFVVSPNRPLPVRRL